MSARYEGHQKLQKCQTPSCLRLTTADHCCEPLTKVAGRCMRRDSSRIRSHAMNATNVAAALESGCLLGAKPHE